MIKEDILEKFKSHELVLDYTQCNNKDFERFAEDIIVCFESDIKNTIDKYNKKIEQLNKDIYKQNLECLDIVPTLKPLFDFKDQTNMMTVKGSNFMNISNRLRPNSEYDIYIRECR